jgi:hypothetical protein
VHLSETGNLMVFELQDRLDLLVGKVARCCYVPDALPHRLFELASARHRFAVRPTHRMRGEKGQIVGDCAFDPFYIPMGRRKKFEPADLARIRSFMRDLEQVRLGPRATAAAGNAPLIGRLAQLGGYDELVRMREAEKRKKEAEKATRPKRKVRLPRFKPKGEG